MSELYIATKPAVVEGDPYYHLYIVYDPDGDPTNNNEIILRGDSSSQTPTSLTSSYVQFGDIVTDYNPNATSANGLASPTTPSDRQYTELSINGLSSDNIFAVMLAQAQAINAAATTYEIDFDLTGITGGSDSNSVVASLLTAAGIANADLSSYLPSGGSHPYPGFEDDLTGSITAPTDGYHWNGWYYLLGGEGGDTLSGASGSRDYIIDGGDGADTLTGNDGDDTLRGGAGGDTLDDGAGTNTVDYGSDPAGVTVSLALGAATDGWGDTDSLSSIQNVIGSAYDDDLFGNSNNNIFYASTGNDTITGGGGGDTVDYRSLGQGIDVSYDTDHIVVDKGSGDALGEDSLTDISYVYGTNVTDTFSPGAGQGITFFGGDAGDHYIYDLSTTTTGFGQTIIEELARPGLDDVQLTNFDSTVKVTADVENYESEHPIVDLLFYQYVDDSLVGNFGGVDFEVSQIDDGYGVELVKIGSTILLARDLFLWAEATTPVAFTLGDVASAVGEFEDSTGSYGSGTGDILTDSVGNATLLGETGNDTYVLTDSYSATIIDGEGTNALQVTDVDSGSYTYSAVDGLLSLYDSSNNQFATLEGQGGFSTIKFSDGVYVSVASLFAGSPETYTITDDGDYIDASASLGPLTLQLGAGNDTFYGTSDSDVINGGDGDDVLHGGAGDDVLAGEGGYNLLYGDAGNDTLIGGDGGYSQAQYDGAPAGIVADLGTGVVSNDGYGTTDTLVNISGIEGSAYADTITAGANGAIVYGMGGSDTITGGTGDDFISGGAGDDTLDGGAGVNTVDYSNDLGAVTVDLSAGTAADGWSDNDTLTNFTNVEGSFYDDNITGDSGDNVITALGGDDTISGGDGNDTLIGGSGNDTLDGGAGSDTADYELAGAGVTVNLSTGSASNDGDGGSDTLSNIENVTGSAYADTITGDSSANILSGGAGDDTLSGGNGDDTLIGGAGNDALNGGSGNDWVSYADATSGVTVDLGAGTATGGGGSDTLISIENAIGSNYADTITGTSSNNIIYGLGGDDTLTGIGSNDTLVGGQGNDTLDGGTNTDTADYSSDPAGIVADLSAGTATDGWGDTDTLSSIETVNGSAFDDSLTGSSGNDTLNGGDGNDTIEGGAGIDILNGGNGIDILTYAHASSGITINLSIAGSQTTGGAGTDTVSNFENLIGSAYNDTLTGDSGNNLIQGGAGNDSLDGGAGTDTVSYADATSAVTYSLNLGSAQNTGGAGTDTVVNFENVIGSAYNDTLTGSSGNNVINGGGGSDTVDYSAVTNAVTVDLSVGTATGDGSDTLTSIENIVGSAYTDTLTGSSNNNIIHGGDGDDTIYGNDGNDTIYGDAGNDYIDGGLGGDTIYGGDGNDTIHGGDNTDIIYGGDGDDMIYGENVGDTINGDAGNDYIDGGGGNNTINGGDGNDTITAGTGNDTIDGGNGTDTLDYSSLASSMTINLNTGFSTGDGTDTLSNIENVIGSSHGDTITGSSGNNVLTGGDGLDTLTGGSGADIFMFLSGSAFNNIDVKTDFSTGDGDAIDIKDLIPTYDPLTSTLSHFVYAMNDGSGNDLLKVDRDGDGTTYSFQTIAQLSGVTGLDAATMVANGNLVVHS